MKMINFATSYHQVYLFGTPLVGMHKYWLSFISKITDKKLKLYQVQTHTAVRGRICRSRVLSPMRSILLILFLKLPEEKGRVEAMIEHCI